MKREPYHRDLTAADRRAIKGLIRVCERAIAQRDRRMARLEKRAATMPDQTYANAAHAALAAQAMTDSIAQCRDERADFVEHVARYQAKLDRGWD